LLLNVCNLLHERYEIHVAYLKDEPLLAASFPASVTIHHVPLGRGVVSRMRGLMKSVRPDIVHTHLGHGDLIGLLASAFLPVRRFCTMHNIWFKWNWKDKVIFAAYRFYFATIARGCTVVCISKSVEDHVRKVLRVPARQARLVYNAIPSLPAPIPREELRRKLSISVDCFCLLFVGRLEKQKSVDTLLSAFAGFSASVPEARLLLVGEGRLRDELTALRDSLGLADRVEFRGVTAQPEEYFAAADLFVLPSIFEGLGIVILEAFRASLPVVASRLEGPAELIQEGRNGLLFPPQDAEALRERLLTMHRDPAGRARMGRAGHADFRERFSIESYAQSLAGLYEERT
jgi:glycosyltransferase involved in cell wall biosynthesis